MSFIRRTEGKDEAESRLSRGMRLSKQASRQEVAVHSGSRRDIISLASSEFQLHLGISLQRKVRI